jgi:hypothetical protein
VRGSTKYSSWEWEDGLQLADLAQPQPLRFSPIGSVRFMAARISMTQLRVRYAMSYCRLFLVHGEVGPSRSKRKFSPSYPSAVPGATRLHAFPTLSSTACVVPYHNERLCALSFACRCYWSAKHNVSCSSRESRHIIYLEDRRAERCGTSGIPCIGGVCVVASDDGTHVESHGRFCFFCHVEGSLDPEGSYGHHVLKVSAFP